MTHKIRSTADLSKDLARRHTALQRDASRDPPEITADYEALMRDGYVIIENLLSAEELDAIRAECTVLLDKTGRNNFEGLKTQRVYDVFSKTRSIDRLADHPRILGLVDCVLLPNYLLSQAQLINIQPGEDAQLLHYDDGFYRLARPRPPLGAATIWAVDDFTEDNGATVIVPGSHTWDDDRVAVVNEAVPAVMTAGSVIFFLGTTWHGGGRNQSNTARLAATCQYCEPYLRQQENFLLELTREAVLELSPELQALVGYSIHPPFMGMVDGKHPKRVLTAE